MQQLADNFAKMNTFSHKPISKNFFYRLEFLICLAIFVAYILMHIYGRKNNSQSIYLQQNLWQTSLNSEEIKIALSQVEIKEGGNKRSVVNNDEIYSQKDSDQQSKRSNYLEQNQNISQNVSQHKVAQPTRVVEYKNTSQEDSNQAQKPKKKLDQENRNCGINATHINGTLMEPVNVNYTRNIYFTVKTIYS